MLSKFNQFSESFKGLIGLTTLTIIIFFTFLILNIFFGPDKEAELKIAEQKKVQEKANELIATLPRGVLTFYKSDKGQQLSAEEYKMICVNTKIITQRAIMGANIIDNDAFDLYLTYKMSGHLLVKLLSIHLLFLELFFVQQFLIQHLYLVQKKTTR